MGEATAVSESERGKWRGRGRVARVSVIAQGVMCWFVVRGMVGVTRR